tara:strand:- start:4 stop:1053 length:1050 start_codon:yes stop_codon:yes gene_type:complete
MDPRVIFRCDAGHAPEIGTGHIARSKTLANALVTKGYINSNEIIFLTRDDVGYNLGKKYLDGAGINYKYFSNNELKANSESETKILSESDAELIFIDRLETDRDLVKKIRSKGIRIVTFDDYGTGREQADLAISSIFSDINESENLIKGYEYLILSSELYKPLPFKNELSTVAVSFGGNDNRNLCLHFLENLDVLPKTLKIEVILGKVDEKILDDYLNIITKKMREDKVNFHIFPKNYHEIISNADLAVTSGGLSIFEFAAWGVPSVALPQYEHQLKTIENLQEAGISFLGSNNMNLSNTKFSIAMGKLLEDNNLRNNMALNAKKCIDGKGLSRILDKLKIQFKDIFHE